VERYFELKGKRQLDYISSQGCRFRCAFCADPFVYSRQWVALPPERVVDDLSSLHGRYGFTDVNFQDETFFTQRERHRRRSPKGSWSANLGITWAGTMRADQGARLSETVVAQCRKSGLRRVLMGVESGSPEMLSRISKDTSTEQVFDSAGKMLRHGIRRAVPVSSSASRGRATPSVQASLAVAHAIALG